jgi:dTDP-4-amino-4,6-dideoxygalactose transaminase
MPNPLAALGRVQLSRLQEMNGQRRRLAARYDAELGGLASLDLPVVRDGATHVYQMYTVEAIASARDALVERLRAHGVGASVHFDPPVHEHPYYQRRGQAVSLPATEALARRILTLPLYPEMTDDDQEWVIARLGEALADG